MHGRASKDAVVRDVPGRYDGRPTLCSFLSRCAAAAVLATDTAGFNATNLRLMRELILPAGADSGLARADPPANRADSAVSRLNSLWLHVPLQILTKRWSHSLRPCRPAQVDQITDWSFLRFLLSTCGALKQPHEVRVPQSLMIDTRGESKYREPLLHQYQSLHMIVGRYGFLVHKS